jgi:hypothetical protein
VSDLAKGIIVKIIFDIFTFTRPLNIGSDHLKRSFKQNENTIVGIFFMLEEDKKK